MKRHRFSEERIIDILMEHGEAEQASIRWIDAPPNDCAVSEPCRKHGVSDACIYKRMAEFGGMDISAAERRRALEGENAERKRMLADAMLHGEADGRTIAGASTRLRRPSARLVSDRLTDGHRFRIPTNVDEPMAGEAAPARTSP